MFGKKYFVHFFFLIQLAQFTLCQDKKSKSDVKVVIIGAGAAGLHSAYKLTEAGVNNVVVLEANDRIGGRINSVPMNDYWIEFGAQWIHGQGENPLWKFAVEKMIPISNETSRGGEGIFVRDDGKEIPSSILEETIEAFHNFSENCAGSADQIEDSGDEEEEGLRSNDPESAGHYLNREFEAWLQTEKSDDDSETRAWRKQLSKWILKLENFDSAADNFFNESSISWCDYEVIEPDTSFLNGYQSVINVWRDALEAKNVEIETETKVSKIQWQNSDGKVVVKTEDGDTFEADHAIVTVSLGYLKQHQSGLFVPQLPEEKVNVINALKYGTTDKIFLEFEEPFWDLEEPGYMFLWSGDELDDTQIDEKNWVHNLLGFDAVLRQPNMLVGWITGLPAKYMETLSDEEISKVALEHLTKVMRNYKDDQEFQLPALKQIKVTRWHSDPLFLGSYSYRETDSDLLDISHSDLAAPLIVDEVPRVLFAGEATTDNYYSAVHGAVASAEREVERILENLTSE